MNTVGVDLKKKPKDLSTSESEEWACGGRGCVYYSVYSQIQYPYGRAKSGTRSESGQGILTFKTGRGKYDVLYDVVCKTVMSFLSTDCSLTRCTQRHTVMSCHNDNF